MRDYGTAQWDGGDAACGHRAASGASASSGLNGSLAHKDGRVFTPYRDTCGKCGARRIDRQIGLEATPDEYLATMVAVFREVRRVLRRDGTCWVNMGDSYVSGQGGRQSAAGELPKVIRRDRAEPRQRDDVDVMGWSERAMSPRTYPSRDTGLKPKDLLMMPARLALALQADGWWVRSAITWCKPSPMPESCTDRPTSATEMVYLLTKRAHYFYDAIAIREDAVSDHPSGNGYKRDARLSYADDKGARGNEQQWNGVGGTRNARNWWVINSKPFPEAHFATYPPALAERCIKAGTSERGCCSQCGKPWVRGARPGLGLGAYNDHSMDAVAGMGAPSPNKLNGAQLAAVRAAQPAVTTGWRAACDHEAAVVPCVVLDPFAGAGTTLLVADRLQRDAIGVELNVEYTRMAMERCRADAPLFVHVPPATDPEDERMADLFAGAVP